MIREPDYKISIGGETLREKGIRHLLLHFEYDRELGKFDILNLKFIAGPELNRPGLGLITYGAPVSLFVGYGDKFVPKTMGFIKGHKVDSNDRLVTIKCCSYEKGLDQTKKTRALSGKTLEQAVAMILQDYPNLELGEVDRGSLEIKDISSQSDKTDLEYLEMLAEKFGMFLSMRHSKTDGVWVLDMIEPDYEGKRYQEELPPLVHRPHLDQQTPSEFIHLRDFAPESNLFGTEPDVKILSISPAKRHYIEYVGGTPGRGAYVPPTYEIYRGASRNRYMDGYYYYQMHQQGTQPFLGVSGEGLITTAPDYGAFPDDMDPNEVDDYVKGLEGSVVDEVGEAVSGGDFLVLAGLTSAHYELEKQGAFLTYSTGMGSEVSAGEPEGLYMMPGEGTGPFAQNQGDSLIPKTTVGGTPGYSFASAAKTYIQEEQQWLADYLWGARPPTPPQPVERTQVMGYEVTFQCFGQTARLELDSAPTEEAVKQAIAEALVESGGYKFIAAENIPLREARPELKVGTVREFIINDFPIYGDMFSGEYLITGEHIEYDKGAGLEQTLKANKNNLNPPDIPDPLATGVQGETHPDLPEGVEDFPYWALANPYLIGGVDPEIDEDAALFSMQPLATPTEYPEWASSEGTVESL